MKDGWGNLTDEQKRELVDLYRTEKSGAVLADYVHDEYNVEITPANLGRRIREYRRVMNSNSKIHEEKTKGETYRQTQINENEVEVVYVGPKVHSLEDLLKATRVDEEEWEVLSHTVNVWEGFRAKKQKDLMIETGVITGTIEDGGGVTVVPLYQVKARLIRKNPVSIEPVIQPLKVEFPYLTLIPSKEKESSLKTALIISDPQFGFFRNDQIGDLEPFHDRDALSTMLELAIDLEPDETIWIGDLLDLPEWTTRFAVDPMMYLTTQPALMEAAMWLSLVKANTPESTKHVLLEGNHDKRLKDMMINRLPSAFGLKNLKVDGTEIRLETDSIYDLNNLLDLKSIGVDYISGYPNNSYWLDNLEVLHGNVARGKPLATVSGVVGQYNHSTIFGHIHSLERASRTLYTNRGIKTLTSASVGCLCRLDYVVPGHKRGQDWQNGLGIVTYGNGIEQIDLLEIVNGTLAYNGKLYNGRTVKKDVQKMLKALHRR